MAPKAATLRSPNTIYLASCFASLGALFGVLLADGQENFGILLAWSALGLAYALVQWLGWRQDLEWLRPREALKAAGVLAWALAASQCAGAASMDPLALALFSFGILSLASALGRRDPSLKKKARRTQLGRETWITASLVLAAVLAILAARWGLRVANGDDPFSSHGVHLFFLSRDSGGYGIFPAEPFQEWPRLAWPALFLALLIPLVPRLVVMRPRMALPVFFLLSLVAELAVVSLAHGGLDILPAKITAMSNHYYSLVQVLRPMGVRTFMTHFNQIQPRLGTHGDSHPFGPELFYWGLLKMLGPDPMAQAMLITLITSLDLFPLWGLVRESGGSSKAANAACLLFLAAPVNTILGCAGIDCIVVLLFLTALWCWLRAGRPGASLLWPAMAGLIAFVASMLTPAAAYLMLFFLVHDLASGAEVSLMRHGLAWALLLGLHLALWLFLDGNFNYLQVFGEARSVHLSLDRPYAVWLWANALLFAGYSGLGAAVEFARRAGREMLGNLRVDPLLSATLLALALVTLQSLGHGQPQRIYQWLYPLICVGAVGGLGRATDRKKRFFLISFLIVLNFVNSVVLEMTVADLW
jgi:hypothetical protein